MDGEVWTCRVKPYDKLLSFKDYWEPGSGVLIRKYKDLELKFKNNKLDHSNVRIKMGELMEVPSF